MSKSAAARRFDAVERQVAATLERLGHQGLGADLKGLEPLIPPAGTVVNVRFAFRDSGRKSRCNADFAQNWNPLERQIVITFDPISERDAQSQSDSAPGNPAEQRARTPSPQELTAAGRLSANSTNAIEKELAEFVLALDQAERNPRFRDFVGIKAFLNQILPHYCSGWASSSQERQRVLSQAIENNLVVKNSVRNPHSEFSTSAVHLNKLHPVVRDVLQSAEKRRSPFHPVPLKGLPLSSTIASERR